MAHSFQYVERERIPREDGGPQDSANCNQCCPLADLRCAIKCYLERHDCTVENGLPRGSKFPIERVIGDPKTKRLLDGHNLLAKAALGAMASPHRPLFPALCTWTVQSVTQPQPCCWFWHLEMHTRWAKFEAKATGSLDGKSIDGMVDSEQSAIDAWRKWII